MAAEILVENATKCYRDGTKNVTAIENISFRVAPSEFLAILGSSGCGKSTIINIIAGFTSTTSGSVKINQQVVSKPGPDRVVVSQNYNLFAWKTVQANVEFGLKARGLPKPVRRHLTERYLELVHLTDAANQYPAELSGGMRQRAALARALVVEPSCLLLDEPLSALDVQMRQRLQDEILSIWKQTMQTVLLVTHDIDEAIYMSDRVLIMDTKPGRIHSIIHIPFDRPRSLDLRLSDKFQDIKRQIYNSL